MGVLSGTRRAIFLSLEKNCRSLYGKIFHWGFLITPQVACVSSSTQIGGKLRNHGPRKIKTFLDIRLRGLVVILFLYSPNFM